MQAILKFLLTVYSSVRILPIMKRRETMASDAKMVPFALPDGRIVRLSWDLVRGACFIDYQLADGRMVMAVRAERG